MRTVRTAPDLVIVNAEVWTMESRHEDFARTTAVAVRDDRIIALGADEEIRELADGATRVVDARGRSLIPGIVDGHTHFQVAAIQRHLYEDYSVTNPRSVKEVLDALAARAKTVGPGDWVRGDGLRHLDLAEQRYPTRDELDRVSAERPVIVVSQGHHAVAANSRALALAGIDERTPDPQGGELERDGTGRLTGILLERAKLRLDPFARDTVVPACTAAEREASLAAAFRHAQENGITGVHDVLADPLEVSGYIDLRNKGALGLRVSMLIRGVGTETKVPLEYMAGSGLLQGLGDEWLRFDGVKMSIDGSHYQRKAATYEPYRGEPDNYGAVRITQDELDAAIAECHDLGLRAVVHAIGPRAVDMSCEAYERAYQRFGRKPIRHRIEHAFLPPAPGQLKRIADLGLTISTQAALIMQAAVMREIYGPDSLTGVFAVRDMLELGIPVIAGTDFPGVPIDPFTGIGFAVNRRSSDGELIDPSQAISLWDSLALYTRNPAWSSYQENRLGTLTPGKLADMVLVGGTLGTTPPAELNRLRADMTIVGGRAVFDRQAVTS